MIAASSDLSHQDIQALIGAQPKMRPLTQPFYTHPAIFALDMARVFGRQWLYAGHSCQIPNPGDWFTYDIGRDSIIVARNERGEIVAFHNTCRHRGSRVCTKESGRGVRLTCPYHAWSYGLDGRLLHNTEEEFGVDRAKLSLHRVAIRDVAGLLFFSLAADPPDFSAPAREIARRLTPHGMDRAKVAKIIDYKIDANWKLVFENNRECYHCPPNHPEYNAGTYDVARDQARTDPRKQAELDARVAEANARFRALGLDEGDTLSTMTGTFWRAHRTPLRPGFTTQSLDGQPVAPLMGDLKERDAGTLRTTVFPNFWQHASDDHAVATRLTPVGPAETHARVIWLVHKDAVEGRDYTLDRLLPVWQRTSEQDWDICRWNQQGVSSSRYEPGPYSKHKEYNVAQFVEWYLGEIADPEPARARASA